MLFFLRRLTLENNLRTRAETLVVGVLDDDLDVNVAGGEVQNVVDLGVGREPVFPVQNSRPWHLQQGCTKDGVLNPGGLWRIQAHKKDDAFRTLMIEYPYEGPIRFGWKI